MNTLSLVDNFFEKNEIIFKKYKIIKTIGKGSFGIIYLAERIIDKKLFALKAEKINTQYNFLESEAFFLYTLQGFGIPKFISYGHTKKCNILIEELLGKSLKDLFIHKQGKCNLIDICLIGIQLLDRLEWIHSKNIIHRDINPENLLIGLKDPNIIYIIDFGFCKKYRSSKTGKHVPQKNLKKFEGTPSFCSTNVLMGKEPSRRDDLISLGYVLIFLIKKKLPWDLDIAKFYLQSLKIKETNDNGKLFSHLPEELIEYINYTRNLEFEEKPDYSYLRSLFKTIITKQNMDYRMLTFSWIYFDNRILFGIPNNHSLKKTSTHNRILKNIQENNKVEFIKKVTRNNISIKPNGNSVYSIEQISYSVLSKKLTKKNYNNKRNNKCNLISNEYRTDNKVNKEINHNNVNIQYLRSINNDKNKNMKKLNNNEDNTFKYINNTKIRDNSNQKYFRCITNNNSKKYTFNNPNLYMNNNFSKNKISTINNSNTLSSSNENQNNIIFKPIIRNSGYSRNNISNDNTIKNKANFSSYSEKVYNNIKRFKKPKIEIKSNNINKSNNNTFNQLSNEILINKNIKKIKNHKIPSLDLITSNNENTNENYQYKNIKTNNYFITNNNIYRSYFQNGIDKRTKLKKMIQQKEIDINM